MKRRRPHGRAAYSLVAALIIIGGIGGFIVWSRSNSSAAVMEVSDANTKHEPAIKRLTGTYVSLSYSGVYSLDKLALGTDDLEAYNLLASTSYEKHVAIAVRRLHGLPIDQDPDYSSRSMHPELYSRINLNTSTGAAVEFVKQDQTERTVFTTHGDKVASLAFISTSRSDELQSEIMSMLDTFQWER